MYNVVKTVFALYSVDIDVFRYTHLACAEECFETE